MNVHPINLYYVNLSAYNVKNKQINYNADRVSADKVFDYLSAAGVYNLTFGSAKKPLYVIDKNGDYQKFEDRKSAKEALSIPIDGIDRCLQGKRLSSHGYGFVYADKIETINNRGEKIIDEKKLADKISEIVPAIEAEPKSRPFYCISLKDGSVQKFNERSEAAKALSMSKGNVAQCLQGKRAYTHEYTFVYAEEIETLDENGNAVLDKTKLKEKLDQVNSFIDSLDKPIPIYAIDSNGRFKKYPSKANAAKMLGISTPHIIKVLNKEINKTGGYTFAFPGEIETINKDGVPVVDRKKLSDTVSAAFEETNSTAVYAIDEYGFYRKFSGIRKAARELSLEPANVSRCLNGGQKRVGNYAFVRAEDIETVDENNRVTVDTEKLRQINKETQIRDSFVPVYTIDMNGKYKRYVNKNRAARAIGVEPAALQHCLKGRYNVVNGYAVVSAEEIETIDENGKTVLNYDILSEKYEQANKNSVYAVNPDGTYQKYHTQKEAADALGIRRTKISQCVNGISTMASGRGFVKASDVETFKEGKLSVNREFLKKIALEISTPRVKAVYLFNQKGDCVRYNGAREAAENTGLSYTTVKECLAGNRDSSKGYRFIYADKFEHRDENGQISVDYGKLDKISEEINPQLAKRNAQFGKIYAIKDVNVQEFGNVREAARALQIDEELIISLLKRGVDSRYGSNSVNGYVFSCEKDE